MFQEHHILPYMVLVPESHAVKKRISIQHNVSPQPWKIHCRNSHITITFLRCGKNVSFENNEPVRLVVRNVSPPPPRVQSSTILTLFSPSPSAADLILLSCSANAFFSEGVTSAGNRIMDWPVSGLGMGSRGFTTITSSTVSTGFGFSGSTGLTLL